MSPKTVPTAPRKMPSSKVVCPQVTFTDQADFPLLANQKGLYDTLSATLDILNRKAAADSTTVNLFFVFADTIIKMENNCHELQHQHEAAAKQCREHEDCDIEMLANYKPGGKTALLLLGQINALLEAHPVINGHSSAPLEDLKKQHDMVELAAEQQLHLLDMTLQTYKLIVACLSCLDKALSPVDVDLAGLLLTTLNISFESAPKDSDVEPANPSAAKPQSPLELPSTPAL
ncbi:hypothetical protein C0989_002867 [Termitomyces sp. Mn162]|nr:hypothetical protein C0989_002867 [Termitomyces sp. Mn162]